MDKPGFFLGLRIIESPHMVVSVEDWSAVRSPGRARRRLKRGFRQKIRYGYKPSPDLLEVPGAIIGHPERIAQLRREIAERAAWEREQKREKARRARGGGPITTEEAIEEVWATQRSTILHHLYAWRPGDCFRTDYPMEPMNWDVVSAIPEKQEMRILEWSFETREVADGYTTWVVCNGHSVEQVAHEKRGHG